jgi:small subunit ribosomal protein S10
MSLIKKKKIRFKFCSYQYEPLVSTISEFKNIIKKYSDINVNVISLPNKRKYYCVNRSPHVNTNSREQFGIEELSQMMEIEFLVEQDEEYFIKFFESLSSFNIPPGVSCGMYCKWSQNCSTLLESLQSDKIGNSWLRFF